MRKLLYNWELVVILRNLSFRAPEHCLRNNFLNWKEMEDKFDNYLKRELDSIDNASIPSPVWDKDKTWKKIAIGLKPQAKMYSIKWLYAAASLILIILLGTSVF